MAIPIEGFKFNHVMPPKLGQSIPSSVSAGIEFTLPTRHSQRMNLREEWDKLQEHDIVFLVSITAPNLSSTEAEEKAQKAVCLLLRGLASRASEAAR